MEELFLALFSLAEELYVIDNEGIDGSELALETGDISLLNCPYESVYEVLATDELNYSVWESSFGLTADGVEQVCLSEA